MKVIKCPYCLGEGKVRTPGKDADDLEPGEPSKVECENCDGDGEVEVG